MSSLYDRITIPKDREWSVGDLAVVFYKKEWQHAEVVEIEENDGLCIVLGGNPDEDNKDRVLFGLESIYLIPEKEYARFCSIVHETHHIFFENYVRNYFLDENYFDDAGERFLERAKKYRESFHS